MAIGEDSFQFLISENILMALASLKTGAGRKEGGVKPPLQKQTQEPTRKIGVWGTLRKTKSEERGGGPLHEYRWKRKTKRTETFFEGYCIDTQRETCYFSTGPEFFFKFTYGW